MIGLFPLIFGFLVEDQVAEVNAFVTDVYPRAGDEPQNFFLPFSAERAPGICPLTVSFSFIVKLEHWISLPGAFSKRYSNKGAPRGLP
jgi:hypothetical protein